MKDGRLQASDLMIGDWVECTYWTPSKQLKVAEIRRIMDDEIKIGVYSDDLVLIFRQSEVRPIPLTPEILEKNGFELSVDFGNVYSLKESQRFWAVYVSEGVYALSCQSIDSTFANIRYVHELQHALRLCGITLNIDKKIEL